MVNPKIESKPAALPEKVRPSPGPRHFRSGYEVVVPVLLGVIVLLLVALIVIMALVLFHLIPL